MGWEDDYVWSTNKKLQFKVALKTYLNTHSVHSVEELLMFTYES
jgi:hypothetical protein